MPRVLVNLVSIIDVTKLYAVHDGNCDSLHQATCPCGTSAEDKVREEMTKLAAEFQMQQ